MIRARAIWTGLLAVAVLGIVTPICDLRWIGSLIGSTYMPVGALFLFFFFVFVLNMVLKLFKTPFSPQELLLIYAMMAVSSGIPSFGFAVHVIPIMIAPFYYATPSNQYAQIIHPLIPDWMSPKNPDTIKWFFEGLPAGQPLPWKDWVGPLCWWTLLVIAIYTVMLSLSIMVRKHWVEDEKLVFPLVQIPLEMVKEEGGKPTMVPAFFKSRIMWLAFLVPAVIYSIKALNLYFPVVPNINLDFRMEGALATMGKPWNALNPFWLKIFFAVIGLTYLIPVDLAFSLWFFYLFFQVQTLIGATLGFQMPMFPNAYARAFQGYQAAGGILMMGVLLLWAMRADLKKMFVTVWKNISKAEDKNEAIGYRLAVIGLIAGFLFICLWAMSAGVKFWAIAIWAVIFFFIVLVTTRFVAEGGLFYVHHEFYPLELMFPFGGSGGMNSSTLYTLAAFNQIFAREYRVSLMPFLLNNLKMSDEAKINRKTMVISMGLAILVVIVVSYGTILTLMYRYGGVNLTDWFTKWLPDQHVTGRAAYYINNPVKPSLKDAMTMVIGGGATAFLFVMRRMFLWWPFHPLGYVMGGGYAMNHIWFSTFLGWLAKVIIIRIGGLKVYQKLLPVFLGLVLGEFVTIGAWVIVDLFTGARGHFLMWI